MRFFRRSRARRDAIRESRIAYCPRGVHHLECFKHSSFRSGAWLLRRYIDIDAFVFVALVFLIAAGSAWEWWKLLRGTKPVVLHESEFIPLSRAEPGGV